MAPDRERQTKPNEPERARRRIQHNKNLTQWKPKSEAGEKSHLKQAARENEDRMAAPGACTARTEDGRLNTEQKEKEPGEELSEQKPKSERETNINARSGGAPSCAEWSSLPRDGFTNGKNQTTPAAKTGTSLKERRALVVSTSGQERNASRT
jgi:hypothetical protein